MRFMKDWMQDVWNNLFEIIIDYAKTVDTLNEHGWYINKIILGNDWEGFIDEPEVKKAFENIGVEVTVTHDLEGLFAHRYEITKTE